ncbi:Arc family DNA-binding protein [Agrobacterium sp. rho-13.3]
MRELSAFNIRMPLELKTWLIARSLESGRSLNSEIMQLIQAARKAEKN